MDTCLRRYDLILVHTYPCLRRYDEMPETQTLRRPCEGSGVTPAKAGVHLSNEVLKLALLTKAFAALTWIPACAGMTKCPKHKRFGARAKVRASPLRRQGSISATQYKN